MSNRANAEALARRAAPYADENARSRQARDYRADPPAGLLALVSELRRAYRDEVPGTLHKHDVDGGGTPAYSGEFAAYLYGSPWATDKDDDTYRTPFRACMIGMHRYNATMATIVARVTIGGMDPIDAARQEAGELEKWMASAIATKALNTFWMRLDYVRRDLRVA
jgi:hypothetical protein